MEADTGAVFADAQDEPGGAGNARRCSPGLGTQIGEKCVQSVGGDHFVPGSGQQKRAARSYSALRVDKSNENISLVYAPCCWPVCWPCWAGILLSARQRSAAPCRNRPGSKAARNSQPS